MYGGVQINCCFRGFWEVKASRFCDIGAWSCQLYAAAVFTPRIIVVLILRGWINPKHMELSDATEKIPSDTTEDRSRVLPTSNVVP
jgi:hypothetical protein